MQNPKIEKLLAIGKEMGQDAAVGVGGYVAAVQFNWIPAAEHVIVGLVTALVCCAGVHYFKKVLRWFDKKVLKLEDDEKDQ